MGDYIDREKVVEYLSSRKSEFIDDYGKGWSAGIGTAMSVCEKFSAADVAPAVHGRWLDGRCTNCTWEAPDVICYDGYESEDWEPTHYCPNCGAKMGGASDA